MEPLPYRIIDADNHFYEPDDCFTRHIEARYASRTVRVVRERPDATGRVYLGDARLGFFSVAVGDHVGAPGMMRDFFSGKADRGAVNAHAIDARKVPAFVERAARLQLLDQQGVEACIMLPTMGVGVEAELRRHPELLYPSLSAYNRWLLEDWGYGGDGRVFGTPLLSFVDPNEALRELSVLLERGAKALLVTPGPIDGRSPADPHFDPIWARLEEARVPVIYHVGASDFCRMYATPWGETPNPPSHRHSAMQMYLGIGPRPVADTIAALLLHDLFGRFPGLRVVSIENGSSWVAPLLKQLDGIARMDNQDMWRFGRPKGSPSERFREHVYVTPYHEDDVVGLVGLLGAARVLSGSDYPHPEGLAEPVTFAEAVAELSPAETRLIMRSNTAGLLGLAP